MAKLWDKEITVDEQISLLEDFSSYLEVSMLVTIEKFKSIIILQKAGWLNDARDFLADALPDICDEVGQYLVKSKLMNQPNWKIFLKERLELATQAGQLLYSFHEDCVQKCISQYQMQYQATYEQELAKQDGLGFGIISNSLAAHLVYAAQSARKDIENEKKASEATEKIMHASSPIDRAAQMTIAFYHKTFDPFAVDFIIGFYSDIERLIYDGLDVDKETLDNNKVLSGNELTDITEDNHRERIAASLSKYSYNGDALFWAIRYDDADDELIEFCSNNPLLLPKYLVAIEQSAVAYLKKQKEKADLYNRDPLTEDIVQLLQRIRAFLTNERMYGVSTYDDIIQDVYGERIDLVCQKFDTLVKIKKTPSALINYAKSNKSIYIAKNDFETLVKYNAIFGTSKIKEIFDVIPDTSDAFDKMLLDLRETIQAENAKYQEAERQRQQRERELAEQKRREEEQRKEAERQAEIERQEQVKKKVKKVAIIVTPIVSALIIFIILLNSVIIPNGNYNKAVALMNDGKYEDAIFAFEALDGYKDSNTKILECKYNKAIALINNDKYEEAIVILKDIGDFGDSSNQLSNCESTLKNISYEKAISLYNAEKYEQAKELFSTIVAYKDSQTYVSQCIEKITENTYNSGINLFAQKKYDEAIAIFQSLNDYKDSPSKIKEVKFAKGEYLLAKKDYSAAMDVFVDLGNYSNASEKLVQTKYEYANYCFHNGNYSDAIKYYEQIGQYKDSKDMLFKASINASSIGSLISFGVYEQDGNLSNGKEDIEWILLCKENGKALLISKYGLDSVPYDESGKLDWKNCYLRTWLNSTFYNSAFDSYEKTFIASTPIEFSSGYSTDNVFILGKSEISSYYKSGSLKVIPTKYAQSNGADYYTSYGAGWWWIREIINGEVGFVTTTGSVCHYGFETNREGASIRPAIWIDID